MLHAAVISLVLAWGSHPIEDVPLRWKPTEDTGGMAMLFSRAFGARNVQVKPFVDNRENKQLIGQNLEDEKKPKPVTTRDDVGAWASDRLAGLLRDAGVSVVSEKPDVIVTGKVTRFMVEETDVYKGVVSVAITITDAKGNTLWQGLATGEARKFGRSYKEDNYMEELSDSLLHAYILWVADPNNKMTLDQPVPAKATAKGGKKT